MERSAFYDQVKERFCYLVQDYGFSVIHEEYYPESYGNAIVVLQSKDCRVRVLLEREQVLVEVGPLWAPEDWSSHASDLWFDLTDITAFLTQGTDRWEYYFPDTSLDHAYRIDRQLIRLAGILRPYCGRVFRLFRPEVFQQKQEELVRFRKQQTEEWLRKYRQPGEG